MGAVALGSSVVAAFWPLTTALSSTDVLQARLGAAALGATACAVMAVVRTGRSALWLGVAIGAAAVGAGLLLAHFNAAAGCLADYDDRTVIVGREYRADAAAYLAGNPGLSPSDRLLDAGGVPERIWTAASIRSCRLWVSLGGLAAVPLFALCAGALISRGQQRFLPARSPTAPIVPGGQADVPVYDAFLSYRHQEPDSTHAMELLERLEARGLRVAIDVRDFAGNEHFLSEMERCIKGSRYVLCVITAQYLASDHTSEEAVISKTLDMAERRKRLVPLVFERVTLPVWLHGLVGIDFTASARVEPLERLHALLAPKPQAERT